METILKYLTDTYRPIAILIYGSYVDATNNKDSDFDCALIARETDVSHDTSVVDGVRLDAFVYAPDTLAGDFEPQKFIQLYGARIVLDETGLAARAVARVRAYVEQNRVKSYAEKRDLIAWLQKMLIRAARSDPEGLYRRHWALVDSLEIYRNLRDQYYFGPKKTLLEMQRTDEIGYRLLTRALSTAEYAAVEDWIRYVIRV